MCEKQSLPPPPSMPSPVGTVRSLSMTNLAREQAQSGLVRLPPGSQGAREREGGGANPKLGGPKAQQGCATPLLPSWPPPPSADGGCRTPWGKILALGFDKKFIHIWEYYLIFSASCMKARAIGGSCVRTYVCSSL
ncbi:hypothetical protein ZWY2020_034606 [Hordeum vulgare]|nr:hypothetical protein ZWY2020_034606 [Hordeum vulgare]